MQIFKQTIKSFPTFLLILFISLGCNPVFAETASDKDAQHAQVNLNLSGLYLGFFPCDDCQGIRTTLALNKNDTYVFITIYVGKSDREFVEKGKFSMGENNTLVLTPRKGSTTTQQYLIDGDTLIKLDEDGSRITKDGADRFILKRKDVMKTPQNHTGH
jgi:copper homeostasis protein (lipoprotein)